MKPFKATFYVYADDENEVRELERSLYDFVSEMYDKGRLVTASRLTDAVRQYGGHFLVANFLKL